MITHTSSSNCTHASLHFYHVSTKRLSSSSRISSKKHTAPKKVVPKHLFTDSQAFFNPVRRIFKFRPVSKISTPLLAPNQKGMKLLPLQKTCSKLFTDRSCNRTSLIEKGAFLHKAIDKTNKKHFHIILKLLPRASLLVVDREEQTPFEKAVTTGKISFATAIANKVSSLSQIIQGKEKQVSILKELIKKNHKDLFKKIVSFSDTPLWDNEGKSVLFYAEKFANSEMKFEIIKHCKNLSYWSYEHTDESTLNAILVNIGGKRAEKALNVSMNGITEERLVPAMADLWDQFFSVTTYWPFFEGWGKAIKAAIIKMTTDNDFESIAQRIRAQSAPVFIPTGTKEHSIVAVFHKNRVFLCNRGESHSEKDEKVIAATFSPTDFPRVRKCVKKLLKAQTHPSTDEALEYIYTRFLSDLNASKDTSLQSAITRYCPLSDQGNVNCVNTSLKTAILATMLSYVAPKNSDGLSRMKTNVQQCWDAYKNFSRFSRQRVLQICRSITSQRKK